MSASALTVLVRAARMAGTSVEASATASATATTRTAVGGVSDGAPGAPTRPAPGLVSSGAASHPAASPAAAASQRQDQVLGQQHDRDQARGAADRLEQPDPPGVLGQPAADQHGHAGDREQPEQPGTGRQDRLLVGNQQAVRGSDARPRGQDTVRAAAGLWRCRTGVANACAGPGR